MRTLPKTLWSEPLGRIGVLLFAFLLLAALFGPSLSRYSPDELFLPLAPTTADHLLGTNDVGNDTLAELVYGARVSLGIALGAALGSTLMGTLLGVVAGYYKRLGTLIMAVVDLFLAVPRLPLVMMLAAFLTPGVQTLVLFFVLFGWPRVARLARSQILSERTADYILAARSIGMPERRILFRHLAPSVGSLALARFVLEFQHVLLSESSLSFLGLGDPTLASWGNMLHHAFRCPTIFISDIWVRWVLPPGLCITLAVLALTFLGYALETRLNPRLIRR